MKVLPFKKVGISTKILVYTNLIFLSMIVFYPLFMLILNSFGITANTVAPTLDYFRGAFTDRGFFKALKNTFFLGGSVTLSTLFLGTIFALLLARTDIVFKKTIRYMILIAFMIPSYIMAMSWIQMLGGKGVFEFLPFNIYSLNGVSLVMTLHLYPVAFMSLFNALNKIDVSVEEAAKIDGCTNFKLFRYIIFPLIRPSVVSIGVFIFAKTIACFGVAALLAIPSREYILSTYIYKSMSTLKIQGAVAISVLMMVITSILFLIQLKIMKNQERSADLNSVAKVHIRLKAFKAPVFLVLLVFFLLTLFLPFITMFLNSFTKSWGLGWIRGNFTFGNYLNLFLNEDIFYRAIKNSVLFGLVAASFASITALVSIFIQNRTASKTRYFTSFLCAIPMAVPEIIIAIAAIFAWMNPPLKLYNTPWILIVSYIIAALPFAYKNLSGLIKNIPYVYEEMAMIDGATAQRAFWSVTVPQLKPGLKTGWILGFLFIIREIPVSSLLYSSGNETIGVLLFNLRVDTGGMESLSAIAVLIIFLTLIGKILTGIFKPGKRFLFNLNKTKGLNHAKSYFKFF